MFEFVLFLVMFVFLFMIVAMIFAALSLPSLGSLVSSLPHQLDIEILVRFFELCVAALIFFPFFFFFLFLPSVWSYRAVVRLVHHLDIS